MISFKGEAVGLVEKDIARAASLIGCDMAAIRALLDVESRGAGFDRRGRPVILFEPHVFWRELGPTPARSSAASLGLARSRWKPGAYPMSSDSRYRQLESAIRINEGCGITVGFLGHRADHGV